MILPLCLLLAADLNPENAPLLKEAWRYVTRAQAPNQRARQIAAFEATPVLAGSLLYVITPFNQVIALDPGSGAEKWRFDPRIADRPNYSEASARGVAVSGGRVFFGTLDARLFGLDAASGRKLWEARLADEPGDGNHQITSPPVVLGRSVIVGSSIGDNGRATMERGAVRAFDAGAGRRKWTWDPTPQGKTGAANAWAPMSVDTRRDMVFIPTGSASPDFYGGCVPGTTALPTR